MNHPDMNELMDLSFDFEDYFERSLAGKLSEAEQLEFDARMIGMFCRDVHQGGPGTVQPWVANALADAMFKVLAGEPWDQALPMPWSPELSRYTKNGKRAMSIYCHVENARDRDKQAGTIALIRIAADHYGVGFATASGDVSCSGATGLKGWPRPVTGTALMARAPSGGAAPGTAGRSPPVRR